MKSRAAAIATSVILGACMSTPADVREQGHHLVVALTSTPAAGAACIARNAENRGGSGTIATTRPGAIEGEFEVIIRQTAISPTVLLVATLAPAAQGSRADIAVRTDLMFTTPEAYARQHLIGC